MSFNRTQPALVRRAYAWAELLAARRSHAIVTVANAMIEQSVAARICRRDKMLTIYSGMEVERFTPRPELRQAARAAWGVSDEQVVVGTIARLFRRKGYEQLLPIMADAAGREPRLHFVWVGDGAQRREYEAELERLGLRKRTTLVRLVPPQRVPELIAGFDVLSTSRRNGRVCRGPSFRRLLMQVPAVAFDIDGTPEVVLDNQTGRLIPLNNFAEFATALVELAADANLRQRLGAAGRAHCLPLFDWRTMVDQLEQLYLRLARR